MQYKLIGKNNYFDPLEVILENRGIKNIKEFMNPSEKDAIHYKKLKNIDKAVSCLLKHIENKHEIFVQVDSDVDGYTSSAALINYLERAFPDLNIKWGIHDGKEHGLILKSIPKTAKLIIAPDSSSNDFLEHEQLKKLKKDVIVLDHHEARKESKNAIVVNNQLSPEYDNKTLTGAGIVYKFLKALDDELGLNYADDYLDLTAIGLIADMADTRNLETRYYIQKGLEKIKNKFLQTLFDKQKYVTRGEINIINVQFYIAPLINAVIRIGSQQEKMQLMKALLEHEGQIYNKKKKQYENIFESTIRVLQNAKKRQNVRVEEGVLEIEKRIKEKKLLLNKILIVNVTDILEKNLTGLVANKIAKKYKRPVLLVRQKKDSTVFAGSARGYEKGFIKNLRQFLLETNKFIYCEGHPNAHGVEIEANKLIEVNNLINEQLKNIDIDVDIYEVDFIIPSKHLKKEFVYEIDKYRNLWGEHVEEPLITIQNVEINSDEIKLLGSSQNVLKFIHNEIEYINFKSNIEEWEKLIKTNGRLVLDVVGRCSINEYQGKKTPQIIIEDYEIIKIKEKEFVF